MDLEAPVPTANQSELERNGLTVLDLTKHAALTILESLDENDRLGVVTFSDTADVVQKLVHMTEVNKKTARNRIQQLQAYGSTNLWHGILKAVEIFESHKNPQNAASIMVLTDGQPNQRYFFGPDFKLCC